MNPLRYSGASFERNEYVAMIPPTIFVSIFRQVEGRDKRTISESNLPCCSHTSPSMSPQIHGKPTYNDRHGRVRARGNQEQSSVLDMPVIVNVK